MRYIVIDTNALIQMLGANSIYRHLWLRFLNGEYVLCVSTAILLEYEEMLKQKASAYAAEMFVKTIQYAENILKKDPHYRLELIKSDPDDNKFVDCAFACQAEYIVTDDSHFDVLKSIAFPSIKIISLADFSSEFSK